ncbi:uncharacterized protein DUF4124 [Pseudomonas duriflava]|uniref:Uncharacterized protein DUF4124 n=1 Tax=Pseudomonas duriflava TaxID=459528 RepID=A0A562QIT1_9PSED|nr:DUF4124 domain-containing protein [Pseudomonas duriflava]TWI56625.1 uncharacterized protein DUF4124 [Pseudomonas duriflava]
MRAFIFILLLVQTLAAQAAVYTYVDAEGNRVFTDKPPRNSQAKPVDIAPTNTMHSGPRTIKLSPSTPVPAPNTALPTAAPTVASYEMLRILIPEPDATVRSNAGDLIVTATSEPDLMPGHFFRLVLDGQPVAEPSRSPVFSLQNIDRGTHQIAVEIITEGGVVIERTPNQPFHLQRTSLAQRRAINPCQEEDWGVRPECPAEDKPEDD